MPSYALRNLKPGDTGRIVQFRMADIESLRKLYAFGLFPGVEVEVLQNVPVYVIKVAYSQIALSNEIAQNIVIEIAAKK